MNKIEANDLIFRMHQMALQAKEKPIAIDHAETTSGFSNVLTKAIGQVNTQQLKANALAESFERGEPVDLAEVMIASQKSTVAFQSMLQVRNRLVSAYQEIMNMPI